MKDERRHAALLDKLRLERLPAKGPIRRLRAEWALAGLILLAGVGSALVFHKAGVIPVKAATAILASPLRASLLDASGYVVARRQATLSAKILGKLVEVNVEEGERVAQGQVVARLDDSNYLAALRQSQAQIAVAMAALAQAKAAYADAGPGYRRYRALAAAQAISAEALDERQAAYDAAATAVTVAAASLGATKAAAAVAEANEEDTVVRAPFAGIVTDKAAQPGEIVAPAAAGGGFTRTGIATVVDMDSLEVQVDVSESYIDRVRPGQPASVRLNAYPDWEIPAVVVAIIPTADEAKGSVKVRLGIKAGDRRILPQMGARVSFMAPILVADRQPVLVPPAAVKHGKGGASVFVIQEGDHVSERLVRLGAARNGRTTILSGLLPGERVAIGDFGKIQDGSAIAIEPKP